MSTIIVPPGATSISVDVFFADDTGAAVTGKVAADFPACKWSSGGNTADTAITLSDLAAITTAHPNDNTAGGVKEREGGWYRLDLPNNMLTAAGQKTLTFAETTNKRVLAPQVLVQYVQSNAIQINGTAQTAKDLGAINVTNLNTLSGHDPGATLASTTNITAGTITTVTNLTNAPTAGDFTSTMKTSLNNSTPTVTISVGTGAGQINLSSGKVPATLASTDVTGNVAADIQTIKTDSTTATNLANTYNGTGYNAATAPAQQQQVSNIAVTGAALNMVAASLTLTTGTDTGGVSNTNTLDGTTDDWADSTGTIDGYYQFDLSGTSGSVAVGATWNGYLVGVTNTLKVYAYNWGGASWDQIGTISGTTSTIVGVQEYDLTSAHTGTGGNLGLVRIRFQNTGLTSATLKTDRILLGYAVVPTFPANFSSLAIDGSGRIDLGKILGTASAGTAGYVGIDWGHVNAPTTTVGLTGTTISTSQQVDLNTIKTQSVTCSGGVTVPAATLASTTNITAGTITTATNLTNAPTSGDFTSTMKTSLNSATPASTGAVTGDISGKVLGGGSGTITGTGARVVDSSGNDVSPASTALTTATWTNARAAKLDDLDATISSRSSYDGSDTSGTTTLLTRIPGTVQPQTGDSYARLGAPAGASVSADIAEVEAETDDIVAVKAKTDNLPADPASQAAVLAKLPSSLSGSGNIKADMLEINDSATAAQNQEAAASTVYVGSVTGAASTTTLIDSALTGPTDNYVGRVLIFKTGTLAKQASIISAYNSSTHQLTFSALTGTPSSSDVYVIV